METMPKEAQIFKRVTLTSIFLGIGFTLQEPVNTYLHITVDVAGVFLMLALHLALAGYTIAFDSNRSKITTAYSALSSGFIALAVPAKVAGFNLPFSTKPGGVYHWVLTIVVAMIYFPVVFKACKVIHSLMPTHMIFSSNASAQSAGDNQEDAHTLTPAVDGPPPVRCDDSDATIVDVDVDASASY